MDTANDPSESLQDELARLRKRVAELEHAEALRQSGGRDRVVADRRLPKQMIGTRIDSTERGHAEMALVRSEQKYKTLIQSIDAIVWEADAQTFEFSFVSEQAEQLLGYPVECWTSS